MKASKSVAGLLAATLTLASAGAFARDRDGDGRRDHDRHNGWEQGDHRQYNPPAVTYDAPRHFQRNGYAYTQPAYTYNAPRYWARGERLPYDWRSRYYTVNDWRAYNLYAPPAGYQWVQADTGDYLLVALATGLIANLLLNR